MTICYCTCSKIENTNIHFKQYIFIYKDINTYTYNKGIENDNI